MENIFQKSRSQTLSINPFFQVRPLLSVSSSEFEEIWKEVKWDTSKVNSVLDLYSRFCREEYCDEDFDLIYKDENIQLMSSQRLISLLRSIAIIGTESENTKNIDFFSRNDLCSIMTGIPFIDRRNFLRLICLLERSTPHTTTSPAGICRLKLVFAYYDWGWKGYLDGCDWKRLRSDILESTYYGKLFNKECKKSTVISSSTIESGNNNPIPVTLEEGLKQLTNEISKRSIRSNDNLKFMNDNNEILSMLSNQKQMIDFPLFVKLVEYRVIKGTSQILRIELPGKDKEKSISYSIKYNCGSIFLDGFKKEENPELSRHNFSNNEKDSASNLNKRPLKSPPNNNKVNFDETEITSKNKNDIDTQIQELDEEINSLKASLGNICLSESNINKSPKTVNDINTPDSSSKLIESIFSQPIENLDGIFSEKNETHNTNRANNTDAHQNEVSFSSIIVPTSSTPIRKSRLIRNNTQTPRNNTEINSNSMSDIEFNQNSKERILSNSANTSMNFGSPPVLI